jgi:hypothetical protein
MRSNTHHRILELPCTTTSTELTTQGLHFPMHSRLWQLLPLCQPAIEQPVGENETLSSGADLQQLVAQQLDIIRQIQRQRRHQARVYLRLRRHHAHAKVQRALRWRLNRFYQLQAEMREVAG